MIPEQPWPWIHCMYQAYSGIFVAIGSLCMAKVAARNFLLGVRLILRCFLGNFYRMLPQSVQT